MKNFWAGKRVLVTGHTGFKGAWLVLMLSRLGAKITGFALSPTTNPNSFSLLEIKRHLRSVIGDIRNFEELKVAFDESKPQIVIHLAAQSLVRDSYLDPIYNYSTNIMGTVNVLECSRFAKSLRACLIVTSDKCYQNQNANVTLNETHSLGGIDPYSSSKACSEIVASSYRNSFFDGRVIATARSGNVFGGGDWSENRLVPDILKALQEKTVASIYYPNSIRPWMHVLDSIDGYLKLAEKLYSSPTRLYSAPWNFGPNPKLTKPVSFLAESFCRHWGGGHWQKRKSTGPKESPSIILNSEKSRKILKWKPKVKIDRAIRLTVDWHKNFTMGANMEKMTLRQIEDYLDL